MVRLVLLAFVALVPLAASACGGSHRHPTLPPPEYEEPASPSVPVTDAGAPQGGRAGQWTTGTQATES